MKVYMKIINSSVKPEINIQIVNIIKFFLKKSILSFPQLTTSMFWKNFLFLYKRNVQLQISELQNSFKNTYNTQVQIDELNKFLFESNKIPQILVHRKIPNTPYGYEFIYEVNNGIDLNIYIDLVFD